ncbi:MAG: winged helix-turn-helix domain-containing protein [Xanthomonadales bacterium]|nr:winged helix-turn-helix domain-containing protein [Xanthomonadales bacterium]
MSKPGNKQVFQSCGLAVYPELGQVEAAGQEIRLGPVNMQVLMLLLRNAGQLVSRTEFFSQVWKNQSVSDDTLTRCISDLRKALEPASDQAGLIETVPKRGYRWLPGVSETSTGDTQITGTIPGKEARPRWKKVLYWALSVAALSLLMSTASLWLAAHLGQPAQTRLAVLPVVAHGQEQAMLAADLDDTLQAQLLNHSQVKFLSASAVASGPPNPYPYFALEFGARWVVEGKLRRDGQGSRASLSLVEAQTGIVLFTHTRPIDHSEEQIRKFTTEFIDEVLLLRLDQM